MDRYAILIGNSRFSDNSGLNPLRCPENDVDGLEEILSSNAHGRFTKVIPVKNKTSQEILTVIEDSFEEGGVNALYLVYYSGHGILDVNDDLYLATSETRNGRLVSSTLQAQRILQAFKAHSIRKAILILDCCNSGAIHNSIVGARDAVRELDADRKLRRARGIYILTASTKVQVAVERPEDEYGLLTKHIIEGIKTGEASEEGVVTMNSLFKYVKNGVTQEGNQDPTKYEVEIVGSDLIIAYAEKLSPKVLRKRVIEIITDNFEDLPEELKSEPFKLLSLDVNNLDNDNKKYYLLLEQLTANPSDIKGFITEWEQIGIRQKQLISLYDRSTDAIKAANWNDAVKLLQEFLELDPNHTQAVTNLGFAQTQLNLANLYAQGIEAFNSNRFGDAIAYFEEINKIDSNYQDVHKLLKKAVNEHSKNNQKFKAEENLRKELDRKQKELESKYEEAEHNFNLEHFNEALKGFRELRNQKTDYRDIDSKIQICSFLIEAKASLKKNNLNLLVKSLKQLRKGNVSTKAHKKYLDLVSEQMNAQFETIYSKGKSLYEEGNYTQSIELLSRIQEFHSDFPYKDTSELLKNARVKLSEKRVSKLDKAGYEKLFEQANQFFNRGINLSLSGKYVESIDFLQQALDILPNHKEIQSELDKVKIQLKVKTLYESGKKRLEAKDWEQALQYFSEIEELKPNYLDVKTLIDFAKRSGKITFTEQAMEYTFSFFGIALVGLGITVFTFALIIIIGVNKGQPSIYNESNSIQPRFTPNPYIPRTIPSIDLKGLFTPTPTPRKRKK